jgi:hypothetical protein
VHVAFIARRFLVRKRWSKKSPKTASIQARHFSRRAAQRYGEFDIDVEAINRMIQDGRTSPIWKESNTRTHHLVEWNGKQMKVVYDKLRKTVVTALPA